jgi:hypothetical protein
MAAVNEANGQHGSADEVNSVGGIDQLRRRLYAYAARHTHVTEDELLAVAEAPTAVAHRALAELRDLQLLHPAQADGRLLVAVPPATAGAQVLMPALRDLDERQRAVSAAFAQITELVPLYEAGALGGVGHPQVHSIPERGGVLQLITELSARATQEVLAAQPGGARHPEILSESLDRTRRMLGRGVRMRTLYQHAAQFSRPTVEHVREMTRLGAEVRTVSDPFTRLLVFDQKSALIPLHGDPNGGATIVTDPSMVDFLVSSFERAWADGKAFPLTYERAQVVDASEELKQSLLRMLVEGHEDTVIAKKLGIGLRTYQRHLSEIMRRIGARNRLHAGYLIRDLGLLESEPGRRPDA